MFYYGNEINIKIEIPVFIFEDFLQKYPMLKIFKLVPKFKSIKRPKLIINHSINWDLQITFNHLKLFDEGRIY